MSPTRFSHTPMRLLSQHGSHLSETQSLLHNGQERRELLSSWIFDEPGSFPMIVAQCILASFYALGAQTSRVVRQGVVSAAV